MIVVHVEHEREFRLGPIAQRDTILRLWTRFYHWHVLPVLPHSVVVPDEQENVRKIEYICTGVFWHFLLLSPGANLPKTSQRRQRHNMIQTPTWTVCFLSRRQLLAHRLQNVRRMFATMRACSMVTLINGFEPFFNTQHGCVVDTTRSESKEASRVIGIASSGIAETRDCMVREGGGKMNVVAIEAMIGLMDAMDISL